MRKQLVMMVALSSAALCACEDGPTQVYKPAPSNAGQVWGDTSGSGYSENAGKDFNNVGGVSNPNELCTPIEKHARWAKMVTRPILPPSLGGINILGGDDKTTTFAGLTIDEAEKVLCQSTPIGAEYTDNNPYSQWGDNGEVTLGYLSSNRRAVQIEVHAGYKGALTFQSRDKAHSFVISADNQQITKDGQPYPLHWKTPGNVSTPGTARYEINELYDALTGSFSTFSSEPDCNATVHCSIADFNDGGGYFSFRTLGILFRVSSTIADIKTASTPERIILRPVKIMGYSYGNVTLKLDAAGEGPVAIDTNALGTGKTCKVNMGLDFKTFNDTCVEVWGKDDFVADGKTHKNEVEKAKLFGGITHNDERFSFGVAGLNAAFTDKGLAADDIIRDDDRPTDDDVATTFVVTSGTLGKIANDYENNDVTKAKDLHGLGLVMLEWINLAQNYIQNLKYADPADKNRKTLGDPRCLVADPSLVDGCTGLEGVVTSAPLASVPAGSPMKVNALGADGALFGYTGLKPASWKSFFCTDANGDINTGYNKCAGGGGFDSFFKTAYNQLVAVYGKGLETNLPPEIRDVRFFFKQFVFAMIKYFQVADKVNPVATLAEVDAGVIDPDNLFFDSIGSGQYEFAEYTDRHLVNSLGQDPTDLVISADTLNGLISDYQFSRDLYRGESAVYDALLMDRANNKVGAENSALLMNVVGSPIIETLYHDVPGGWTAYQCATANFGANDAQCKAATDKTPQRVFEDSTGVLVDDSGQPVLKNYPGAFVNKLTPFAIAEPTDITITKTIPFIRSAHVQVPLHVDPFDPSSTALPPHETLVPWLPKGSGAGFYVAVNGSQDKFINTHELDFSGTTISLNMNFIYPPDPITHQDDFTKKPKVAAAETTDFLGEYWICQDPDNGDVLRVRMYTSAQTILQWFTDHPSSVAGCDVVFRYGPFGNYLDYITARATGVRLGINPGSGSGRVIDITAYDPAYN